MLETHDAVVKGNRADGLGIQVLVEVGVDQDRMGIERPGFAAGRSATGTCPCSHRNVSGRHREAGWVCRHPDPVPCRGTGPRSGRIEWSEVFGHPVSRTLKLSATRSSSAVAFGGVDLVVRQGPGDDLVPVFEGRNPVALGKGLNQGGGLPSKGKAGISKISHR